MTDDEFCLLLPPPLPPTELGAITPASRARSTDACDERSSGCAGELMLRLRVLYDEDERCLRALVGR